MVPERLEGALAIEFAHRTLSGIALLAVAILFVTIRRTVPHGGDEPGRQLRRASGWAMVTIIGEALIGAGIVLFEWVNADSSVARTIAVPLHLVNTFLLMGALGLVAWLAQWRRSVAWTAGHAARGVQWGLGLMVIVAATGAVTALADTLFPKEAIGFSNLQTAEAFLTNLRVFHPAIAAAAGLIIVRIVLVRPAGSSTRTRIFASTVVWLVGLQLVAGVLNVVLFVPVWMQLAHLALADALWVVFVWYAAETMAVDPQPARVSG